MSRIILLNKPFDVLCQFTDSEGRRTLGAFIKDKGIYPAGRLDRDSEGLVILTDDGALQHCIAHPSLKLEKTYWVQVEGIPDEAALEKLRHGIILNDGPTLPARVERIDEPEIWVRTPPIRHRVSVPTSWLSLTISEGRNRQVRRMTAAIGFPTLRLVRWRVGKWCLDGLLPGENRELDTQQVEEFRSRCPKQRTATKNPRLRPPQRRHNRQGNKKSR